MSLILMGALVLFGSYMLKRRGAEEKPADREGLLKRIRSFLREFKVIEDGREATERPAKPSTRAPSQSNSMDKIYDPPLQLLGAKDGYGIELNSGLTEDERVEEIVGLQELWDKSKHDTEKEEKGSA